MTDNALKILDHKWLDQNCINDGCQSLLWASRVAKATYKNELLADALKAAGDWIESRQEVSESASGRYVLKMIDQALGEPGMGLTVKQAADAKAANDAAEALM